GHVRHSFLCPARCGDDREPISRLSRCAGRTSQNVTRRVAHSNTVNRAEINLCPMKSSSSFRFSSTHGLQNNPPSETTVPLRKQNRVRNIVRPVHVVYRAMQLHF